jgi:hypothetical protein
VHLSGENGKRLVAVGSGVAAKYGRIRQTQDVAQVRQGARHRAKRDAVESSGQSDEEDRSLRPRAKRAHWGEGESLTGDEQRRAKRGYGEGAGGEHSYATGVT